MSENSLLSHPAARFLTQLAGGKYIHGLNDLQNLTCSVLSTLSPEQINSLLTQVASYLQSKEQEISRLRNLMNNYTVRYSQMEYQLTSIQSDRDRLQASAQYHKQTCARQAEEIARMVQAVKELQEDIARNRQHIKKIEGEIMEKCIVIKEKEQRLQEQELQIQVQNNEIDSLTKVIDDRKVQFKQKPQIEIKQVSPSTPQEQTLAELIPHPSVVVIIGGRNTGKSCTGFRVLEELHSTKRICVLGFPPDKKSLLPEWIQIIATIDEIPPDSITLVDECYTLVNSRRSQKKRNLQVSRMLNLSRHRRQSFIFIAQDSRQVDPNVLRAADIWIVKSMRKGHALLERPELKSIFSRALEKLEAVATEERKQYAYIDSPDMTCNSLVKIPLPSFWSEELSTAYSLAGSLPLHDDQGLKQGSTGGFPPSKKKKLSQADELYSAGHSFGTIANLLDLPKTTVYRHIKNRQNKSKGDSE